MNLHDNEFYRLKDYLEAETGIKLPPSKKIMLESRLRKRVHALDLGSFSEYCDLIFSEQGLTTELLHMVDTVTTNKTDFFREPDHFTFLSDLLKRNHFSETLKIWSSACSTGEEPYTIAMVLEENKKNIPESGYQIVATDISYEVIEKGKKGIYREDKILPLPGEYKARYFLRSKDREKNTVRIKPEIRSKVIFKRYNLMNSLMLPIRDFDVIFCRNVLIYFNRDGQEKVLKHLYKHLRPGGYLFLGHSETIFGMDLLFYQEAPTIYKKPEERRQ